MMLFITQDHGETTGVYTTQAQAKRNMGRFIKKVFVPVYNKNTKLLTQNNV